MNQLGVELPGKLVLLFQLMKKHGRRWDQLIPKTTEDMNQIFHTIQTTRDIDSLMHFPKEVSKLAIQIPLQI